MHIAVVILVFIAAWKWGDWKNWSKYHTTILFVAAANLLYNFLYNGQLLWQLKPDLLQSHKTGELFFTFIVFPCTTLLFLSKYPKPWRKQVFHNLKFIAFYFIGELTFYIFGKIEYHDGWNIWWSLGWDCMMFPMWALHHKKPLWAYSASFILVITMTFLFPVKL